MRTFPALGSRLRARRPFLLSMLVLLAFVQGLWLLAAGFFLAAARVAEGRASPATAVAIALSTLFLLLPAFPAHRLFGRRPSIMLAAALVAVARLAATAPVAEVRLVASALVVAGGGAFLAGAVGDFAPRIVVTALTTALVLDEVLRLAGNSYDVSLRAGWIPVQIGLTLLIAVTLAQWERPPHDEESPGMERRASGLRLRGALALGGLLFLEMSALGAPAAVARWTGAPYAAVAAILAATGAAVLFVQATSQRPPAAGRGAAFALTLLAVLAPIGVTLAPPGLARAAGGWPAVVAFAAGHAAALLLFVWVLAPAGGRRGTATAVGGMLMLLALLAAYTAGYFPGYTLPFLAGAAPWLFLSGGVIVTAAILLIPRPAFAPTAIRRAAAAAGAATLALAAVVAAVVAVPGAPAAAAARRLAVPGAPATVGEAPAGGGRARLRVATYNVHWGVREDGVLDPAATARAIAAAGADVVALEEVPAGLPVLYSLDLGRWLAGRLGMRARFAPTAGPALGDLLLSRLPIDTLVSRRISPQAGVVEREPDPRQVARATVRVGPRDSVVFYFTRLGSRHADRARELPPLLAAIEPGAALLAGDLNAGPDSDVLRALEGLGFRDAFAEAGAPPQPTSPARSPRARIDWILVRGYAVEHAGVLDGEASDHRLVYATVRLRPR